MPIIVYSTATCPYCTMAKNWLKEKGIEFTDFNVGKDKGKAREMIEKSHQMAVPVIDFNGEIIIGFDQGKLEMALRKQESKS